MLQVAMKFIVHLFFKCGIYQKQSSSVKVCNLCLSQADDYMTIKRDYLGNGQLNISTNRHKVNRLFQVQGTKFVSLY